MASETVIKDIFGKMKYNCGTALTVVSNLKDRPGCHARTFHLMVSKWLLQRYTSPLHSVFPK